MTAIRNIEGMTMEEMRREISMGARFVVFEYAISILVMTFRRSSDIYFLRSDESHWGKSFPFTLLSLLLGWWGFPWGIIYTPAVLYTNLSGGKDVTGDVLDHFNLQIGRQAAAQEKNL
jgi:hypothetical protein